VRLQFGHFRVLFSIDAFCRIELTPLFSNTFFINVPKAVLERQIRPINSNFFIIFPLFISLFYTLLYTTKVSFLFAIVFKK